MIIAFSKTDVGKKRKTNQDYVYTYEQLIADSVLLEKYGREQLNMHKPNEDVFVILHE